ncbi:MAG: tetratricopeptide repeat protein, partial [Bacteroidales bacterium]
ANFKKNYDTEIKWAIKHNKLDSLLIYILRQEAISSENTSYLQTLQRLHQYQNKIEFLRSKETKRAHTDTLYAKYLLYLANAQAFNTNHEAALKTFAKIYKIAESSPYFQAQANNGFGVVFAMREQYEIAREYFKKSVNYYKANHIEKKSFNIYCNIGGTYLKQEKFDSALVYFLQAKKISSFQNLKEQNVHVLYLLGVSYQGLGQYELAEKQYEQAKQQAIDLSMNKVVMYIEGNMVNNYIAQKKYNLAFPLAISTLKKAKIFNDASIEMSSLHNLSKLYEVKNEPFKALLALKESNKIKDSLFSKESENKILAMKANFDKYKIEQEKALYKTELELSKSNIEKRNLWLVILGIIILAIIVVVVVLYKRILIQCKVNNILNEQVSHLHKLGTQEAENVRVELMEELDAKSKELMVNTMLFIRFKETAVNVKEKLHVLKVRLSDKPKEISIIENIEQVIKEVSTNQEWDAFKIYFEQVNENFYKKLKEACPDITSKDMRLCALLSINLSTKEISSITNISVRGVESGKLRLRKKLNLERDETLFDALKKFK